ncbi:MAG TPA: hypothetical protein DHV65_13340 [Ktedonobacter sp.]|nr:hypothetical protein [Ktedonobacter sp.]
MDGSNTQAQGSPQVFAVTLTVLPPCQLQVGPLNLSFAVAQGQPSPSAQSFSLSETGNCAPPITWQAQGNAGSNSWLVIGPPTSGTGSGTVSVGVNSQSLAPGSYTGKISVSASGNGGAIVENSPSTITVTLTVTGYTFSGTVIACADTSCVVSKPLPGATLSLLNTTTNHTITIVADGSGNFTFTNLAIDPYTLTASGSDGILNYLGTVSFSLNGDKLIFPVDVYPH